MRQPVLISNAERGDEWFDEPLEKATEKTCGALPLVMSYREINDRMDLLNEAPAIIIGGSPLNYGKKIAEKRAPFFQRLINEGTRPLGGICLGLQIVGTIDGVKPRRDKKAEREIGERIVKPYEEYADHPLFKGLTRAKIKMLHRVSMPELPSYNTIASSYTDEAAKVKSCETQIVWHENFNEHPRWGIQGHPEDDEYSEDGHKILKNFFDLAVEFTPVKSELVVPSEKS